MKKVVISGINLTNGGPMSIMTDVLKYASNELTINYSITAIVHDKSLFKGIDNINFIEIKKSKKRWIYRLYYEYFYFLRLSKKIKPYFWLSLHDITPNVKAERRAVYCHNASSFYKMSALEKKISSRGFMLFNMFYKYLYKINIKKNNYVIVQQDWIREKFKKLYKIKNVIVAYPNVEINSEVILENHKKNKKIFFYPAFPRPFKNFEIICEAAKHFKKNKEIEFVITIKGNENKYAEYLKKKYGHLENLKFIGLLSKEEVFEYYKSSEALIFPSKLETWGLPITEYKAFNKPIFLADLKYAHETVGTYDKVSFFKPWKEIDLIKKIESYLIDNKALGYSERQKVKEPFAQDWERLFKILLEK